MGDGVAIKRLDLLLSLATERLDLRYRYTTFTCATCGRDLYWTCATDAVEICTGHVLQMRLILRDPLQMPHT